MTKIALDRAVEIVRERAQDYFEEATPAHDWHHVQRVEQLSETLSAEQDDANEQILRLAVLLHDIGRVREDQGMIDDHAVWGANEAEDILSDVGLEAATVEHVQHCIRTHRYSNDLEPETIEAKLLCDADNLDALGAVGIGRCFAYGTTLGNILHDPEIPLEVDDTAAGRTQLNHFYKKILSLPDRMYTEPGRCIAEERQEFVEQFVDRFKREAAGEL